MMNFNDNLKYWRVKRGFTQEMLAEALGISRQAVAKWETGAGVPDVRHLLKLCETLSVSADRLLKDSGGCSAKEDGSSADMDSVAAFLLRASKVTYAGYGKEDEVSSRPGSHDLRYEEKPYLYIDTYLGGELFGGEEAVFENGRCIWLMNYCGRVIGEGFSGDFLKEALRERPLEMPYRGPVCFRCDEFCYVNHVSGNMEWFSGEEEIFCGSRRIYECRYHGGSVRK